MKHRRLWRLSGLVALVCVARAMAVPGQDGEPVKKPAQTSHRPAKLNLDPFTAEDIISARLNLTSDTRFTDLRKLFKNKAMLRQLTKGLLTNEQMRVLDGNSDKIQQLLQDNRFREFLEDTLQANKEGRPLTEDQIATLKRLADSNFDPNSIDPSASQGGANNPDAQGQERGRAAGQGHSGTRETQQSEDAGAQPEQKQSWLERQFARISSAIAEEMNNPANAGAFQNALRSLGGIKEGNDGAEQFDFGGLWKSATEDAAGWVASRWEWPGLLAAAPREFYRDLQAAIPEISGSVGGALAKVPTDKFGGGASGGIPVEQIAWVVAAVAVIAIAWQSIGKRVAARIAPRNFRLGPWPVQPNSVADRNDIVAAFEYLALLRLGAVARATNHIAVAARLQSEEADAERRAAAGTLARLYERLRYEPHPAPLGANELAAARKNLSMLARAAAA
jgi:hypothetical protein